MYRLDRKAAVIMDRLVSSMTDGYLKLDNNSAFMPVVVEHIGDNPYGALISVAHYGKQNGDPMRDPDVVLLHARDNGSYYPVSYRNDYVPVFKEAVRFTGPRQEIIRCRQRMQKDFASFVNRWMKAIYEQQLF